MDLKVRKLLLIAAVLFMIAVALLVFIKDPFDIGTKDLLLKDKFALNKAAHIGEFYFDTLAFKGWIEKNNDKGTVLLKCYQKNTVKIKYAVINYRVSHDTSYIFAVIARSKENQPYINIDDLVGYYSSFGCLDSTKKGTAFFYLLYAKSYGEKFTQIWKKVIPIHNGFDMIYLDKWHNTDFLAVQFLDALSQGRIWFNFFFIGNNILREPHMLQTYQGIDTKRTFWDINGDEYPDYYEHIYYNTKTKIYSPDSVGFIWDGEKYKCVKNPKITREY